MAYTINIEKDLRPAYYDDFRCLAGECRLTCCKGWNITFDKKDYLSLKRQKGSEELNARLKGGLRRIRRGHFAQSFYGEFNMDSNVCPFLREDGLCQLQREKGPDALPEVCRSFPRIESNSIGYWERSLSPACEGVLALLWDLPDGIEFRSDALPKEQRHKIVPADEGQLSLWFPVVREWCIDRLQDRRFTLPQRIWMMGLGLKELADGETDIQRWMAKATLLPESIHISDLFPGSAKNEAIFLTCCLRTLISIHTVDKVFEKSRDKLLAALKLDLQLGLNQVTIPTDIYRTIHANYKKVLGEHEYFMENLMVSILFHLRMPHMNSTEDLWKGYINFCNMYAFYQFLAVMSCREGVSDYKAELFCLVVLASRALIHSPTRQHQLRDEFFQNDSATLAHMAILLGG